MSDAVLDASALLAVLNGEPGGEHVVPVLFEASVSTVNLAEVVTKMIQAGAVESQIRQRISGVGLTVVPFDQNLAYQTGLLTPQTRRYGLSLGDRACLALGKQTSLPVYTAERIWARVDVGVTVVLIR